MPLEAAVPVGDADFNDTVSSMSVVVFSWTEAGKLAVEGDMTRSNAQDLLLCCGAVDQQGEVFCAAETMRCCIGKRVNTLAGWQRYQRKAYLMSRPSQT